MRRSGPVGVRWRRRFGERCCEAAGKKISLCCVLNRRRKEQGGLGFVACAQWGGTMRPVARAVLRNARVRAPVTNLLTAVEGIGFIATEESSLSLVLAAMLIVGVGGFALTAAPVCGVALALCVAAACAIYAKNRKTSGASVCERPFPTRCARWRCAFGRGSRFSRRCSRLGLLRKALLGCCSSAQLTFSRRVAARARHSRFFKGGTRFPSSPSFLLRLTCSIKRGKHGACARRRAGDCRR